MVRSRRPKGEGRLIQVVYYAYVAGSAVARAIPERVAYALAQTLGTLAARRSKKRPTVASNISRITGLPVDSPEVQDLVTRAFRSYARYWLETFSLVREGPEYFLERFRVLNADRLWGVLARGKGALVVVGHLGNWDAAGAWVGANGRSLVTVAEVLKPRRMFDFFVEHRARLGMTIFPAESGVTARLVQEIENGAVVAILGDRDLKGTGPEVEFFGERATLPAGAASIALKTGVPIVVAGVYSERMPDGRRGWMTHMSRPIEIPDEPPEQALVTLTRAVGRELETAIARHPEEWHVFQPFWPADRDNSPAGREVVSETDRESA